MRTCKNCGSTFEGEYCNNCGQRYIDQRINLKDSLAWAVNSIFNLDKGILHTSIQCLLKPEEVISSFLNGITVRYTHPFRFLFIWATISAIIGVYFGTFDEQSQMMSSAFGYSEEKIANMQVMLKYLKQYFSFVIMLLVPFVTIASGWFYKKKALNYAEHLIINAYGFGTAIIIGIPITLLEAVVHLPSIASFLGILINLTVMARVYHRYHRENYLVSLFKYILTFALGYVLVMISVMIITLVIVLLVKFIA